MFVDLNGLDYNGMPSNVQAQLGLPPNPTPKRDPSPKVEEPAEGVNNIIDPFQMNISGFYPLMINGLIEIQDFVLAADIYQEGGCGNYGQYKPEDKQTFCNFSSFDCGEATGFHMNYVYGNKTKSDTTASMAYKNLKKASVDEKTGIVELPSTYAQVYANKGFTVFALADDTSHMATVRPSNTQSIFDVILQGPLLANIGPKKFTGVVTASKAFGADRIKNNNIHYFMDTKQSHIYSGTINAAKEY